MTTTETERLSFLGIPVIGEINKHSERKSQRPLAELEPLIRNVVEDPEIYAFGWAQYTPYFNDGEPCVFWVGDPWFLTIADVVKLFLEEDGKSTQPAEPRQAEPIDRARELLRRAGINPDEVLKPTEPQPTFEPVVPVAVDRSQLPEFDDLPEFDEEDYTVSYGEHPTLGKATYSWVDTPDGRKRLPVPGSYTGSHAVRYNAAQELSRAFESKAFDDVLLTAFGDHCRVVVQRSGIHVDEYSHD